MAQGLFLVDVEATGLTPISDVMTEFSVVEFDTFDWFHGSPWDFEPPGTSSHFESSLLTTENRSVVRDLNCLPKGAVLLPNNTTKTGSIMKFNIALRAAATAAATAVFLSGCATETASKSDEPAVGSNASEEEAVEEVVEEEPEAPTNLVFGETATFEDGLEVTVSEPADFTPSEYAFVEEGDNAFVKFDVIIVNGTESNYDASLTYATLQSADTESTEVFDTDGGIDGSPMTKVLPGRQTKYSIAFGVNDPKDLVMEFSTGDFERDSIIYTN